MLTMSQNTRAIAGALLVPGQQLERREVGPGEQVGLGRARESVDRAAVEGHALVEGVFEFRGRDVKGLVATEDVGEPELDEAHAALFDGAKHVLGLTLHARHSRTFSEVRRRGKRPAALGAGTCLDRRGVTSVTAFFATAFFTTFFAAALPRRRRLLRDRRRATDRLDDESPKPRTGRRWRSGDGPRGTRACRRDGGRDAHRGATVGDAVGELGIGGGLVRPGQAVLDAVAVDGDVLFDPGAERLGAGNDRVEATRRRASASSRSWCGRPRRSSHP